MKNFKFRSIITSIISFIAALTSVGAYYSYTNLQGIDNNDKSLNQFLSNVKHEIIEDDKWIQLNTYDDKRI